MESWIKVYSATEEYQAEIIKSLLSSNGLNPVLYDRKGDGFRLGNVDVYTTPEEAEQAIRIIDSNETDLMEV